MSRRSGSHGPGGLAALSRHSAGLALDAGRMARPAAALKPSLAALARPSERASNLHLAGLRQGVLRALLPGVVPGAANA